MAVRDLIASSGEDSTSSMGSGSFCVGSRISPKLQAQDMEADAPAAKMLKEQGQQAEAGVTPCAQHADENKAEPGTRV